MKKLTWVILISLLIIALIFIGILIYETINMLIDHECYQLQPNDYFNSSICERYWNGN